MTIDPDHRHIEASLEKLDHKIESVHDAVVELQVLVAANIATHSELLKSHERELKGQSRRIGGIEGRMWKSTGAVALGAISFIGTLALFILTLL